jgi:hypothetical protein
MSEMEDKKSGRISVRLTGKLRERLNNITAAWGPNDVTMAEDALTALCDYVEAAGKYQRPMKMVYAGKNLPTSRAEMDAMSGQLNESQAPYSATPEVDLAGIETKALQRELKKRRKQPGADS